MRRIGYARVSTEDQSLNLQLDALNAAKCDLIFQDVMSGATNKKRSGLDKALKTLREGDQLLVWKLDRLGRSFRHLVEIADLLQLKKAHLISINEGIDTSSNVGEVIFRLLMVFADFERKVIAERTIAGIKAARARGSPIGRPSKLTREQILEADLLLKNGQPADLVAYRFGVARSTLHRSRQILGLIPNQ